jgi:hypothetical protein
MRTLSFIEDPEVIKKVLKHLGLWFAKRKPQPVANAPPTELHIDYSDRGVGPSGPEADSQIPSSVEELFTDADYAVESSAI